MVEPSELTAWRRHLHQYPECAFQEVETAAFIAQKLQAWGYDVVAPLATTGIVASLSCGSSERAIGLRADMDALPMQEGTARPWHSRHDGRFHACGHDGHIAMLLGAAWQLAQERARDGRAYDGTVRLIFQPAEEGKGGGREMIRDGLFERFAIDEIYAIHNWPSLPLGQAAVGPGAMMAAADRFDITFSGPGGHAAMPHLTPDIIVAAGDFIGSVQTIVSRTLDPAAAATISIGSVHGGTSHNVLPDTVRLSGTVRSFDEAVRDHVEIRIRERLDAIAAVHHVKGEVVYDRYYPATVNHPRCARHAADAAERAGLTVNRDPVPALTSEDFSFMLQARPGAYVWLGQGDDNGHDAGLHSANYDFNDDLLPIGARFFVQIVKDRLGMRAE